MSPDEKINKRVFTLYLMQRLRLDRKDLFRYSIDPYFLNKIEGVYFLNQHYVEQNRRIKWILQN